MGCVHCRDRRSNVGFPLLTSRNCEYPHVKSWSVESQSVHSWVIASTLPEQNYHCHSKSRAATFQKLYCKSYSGHMELVSTKQTLSEQSRAGLPPVFGELWELGTLSTPIGFDRSHLLQLVVLGTDLCLHRGQGCMNLLSPQVALKKNPTKKMPVCCLHFRNLNITFKIYLSKMMSIRRNHEKIHDESWFWLVQIYIFRFQAPRQLQVDLPTHEVGVGYLQVCEKSDRDEIWFKMWYGP